VSRAIGERWGATAGCAALYLCSILVLLVGPWGHGWGFVDLTIYRYGGQAVLDHANLYTLRFPGALAFTYPPLSAVCFTVLTAARMAIISPLVTTASLLLTPVMFVLALRLAPASARPTSAQGVRLALLASALAIWLEPIWTTLRYGQINLLIVTLILFDLSRSDTSRWKGVGIGLAIGLKLTPAIFVVYLLLTRRYRAAATALTVFAATVAVGFAAIPRAAGDFWGGAFVDPSRVGRIENTANQTLRGAYSRVLHSVSVGPLWLCTAAVLGAIGLALAAAAGRRGDDAQGFSLCAITGLLISPVSWSHHWVIAIPALFLFALGAWVRRSAAGLAISGLVTAIGLSHVIWWVPVNHPAHSELHLDPLQLIYSNLYVIIGVAALLWATRAALRDRGSGRPILALGLAGVRSRRPLTTKGPVGPFAEDRIRITGYRARLPASSPPTPASSVSSSPPPPGPSRNSTLSATTLTAWRFSCSAFSHSRHSRRPSTATRRPLRMN